MGRTVAEGQPGGEPPLATEGAAGDEHRSRVHWEHGAKRATAAWSLAPVTLIAWSAFLVLFDAATTPGALQRAAMFLATGLFLPVAVVSGFLLVRPRRPYQRRLVIAAFGSFAVAICAVVTAGPTVARFHLQLGLSDQPERLSWPQTGAGRPYHCGFPDGDGSPGRQYEVLPEGTDERQSGLTSVVHCPDVHDLATMASPRREVQWLGGGWWLIRHFDD